MDNENYTTEVQKVWQKHKRWQLTENIKKLELMNYLKC